MQQQSKFISGLFLFLFFSTALFSQPLTDTQIDSLVEKTIQTFNVPGMAVAVLKDGEIISQKGYGIQSVQTNKKVDTKTLFGVASNTKAFTTAALAQLIDEGKIEWDTKVTDIIPEFKLYDSYVTAEFTIRDLLVHRSGLGLGAGDLMVFPAANTTTMEEMIHNLRYLKPVSSFRSKFDYDNLFYIVAGEIVSRITGEEYDLYIENNFFKPLGMKRSTMNWKKIDRDKNRIDGHTPIDGELQVTRKTFTKIGDAAAGIYASIEDMSRWVEVRLNNGKYGDNLQDSLFSLKQAEEMWRPQNLVRTGKGDYNTHYQAYALGWFIKDVNGYQQVSHTGGLLGIVSQVTLIPELNLGIVVLTNQESGAAFTAITNSILDGYFDIKGKDRIQQYNQRRLANEKWAEGIEKKVEEEIQKQLASAGTSLPTTAVLGTYKDNWFGEIKIKEEDNKIRFISDKSPDLVGTMYFYKGTTFAVRWDDPSLKADAFVNFSLDTEGKANGFLIEAISPLTDFSYDFQDLEFTRNTPK